ncbi:extracellular calcium-sensing receptor-like [Gadus chalcogrammus]|uniref:extracellular calcium-sensing receptor-like n=1 Tax=Gadus chalcogrammus TaxID=1042646 RepID=UPI0024C4BFBF|nr:extracellular calcium-sensing receptor-like [Gadus chalcogrammus]
MSVVICDQDEQQCKQTPGSLSLPVLQRIGDVTLGGLFPLHETVVEPHRSFTTLPSNLHCTSFSLRIFRMAQSMIFAIEEINREGKLLPNVTLGYKIYDSCSTPYQALKAAMELMGTEQDSEVEMVDNHMCPGTVPVVIGDAGSTQSLVVARFLGAFHVPQVSYFSSCACLSNKKEYPAFLRTMPSDLFQVDALVQLVKHFQWTWVGVIAGDDVYGRSGAAVFANEVKKFGACVALQEIIPKNHAREALAAIVSRIRSSGALVVLVFAVEQDAGALFDEALRQGLTGIQWLASEAWSTAPVLSTPPKYHQILQGTIGLAVRGVYIPGLQDFLLRLHPSNPDASENPFLIPFWEKVFGCRLGANSGNQIENDKPLCSGSEDLRSMKNIYSDFSKLRISYNVYKAVYAIAHAIKSMMSCKKDAGPFPLKACPDTTNIQPWQLLHYLKEVDYINQFGEETKFDHNGDPVAIYDLLNWQLGFDGEQIVTIGMFDGTATADQKKLKLQEENIIWNGNKTTVPESVCSSPCLQGTRKAIRPNFPICCHDCVVCRAGEISNQTNSIECVLCLPQFWSNVERTACFPKEVDFLSFSDTMGITLITIALLGSLCTCWVIFIFSCHISSPIVRANNSELSFLLLFSLTLCFLCSLTFIGRPSDWSCMLRQTAFGITFVLCISCVLGKTIVVLMAFRATLPGSNLMKWFGPVQQRAFITLSTLVQVIICIIWLTVAPPTPQKLMPRESAIVILLCDEGSALGFALVLGYIGLLACLCLFLAFLARKLPDNFNEAKYITFSMLIFCAVWVAFIPAYISSPGKYAVAVEIFAILASSYGLLACIFAPKCYIILLKPEKNSRKHLMSKTSVQ